MKRMGVLLIAFLLMSAIIGASAEGVDISQMTYDELSVLRDKIDMQMEELRRQYAIENGNRVITLDVSEIELFEKQRQQLTASVERITEEAPQKTSLIWSTSNETVATVTADGRVTAVAYGDAIITCTAADDEFIFASIPIRVGARVADITVEPKEGFTLRLSDKDTAASEIQLSYVVSPDNAFCQSVRWISSDETVVMVDESGYVRAIKAGTANITAISNEEVTGDMTQKKSIRKVTVVRDASEIVLDQNEVILKKGSTLKLNAQVLPEDTTDKKIVWESSDDTVVKVTSGQLNAVGCGSCVITSKAADGSGVYAECFVTVYQPVTSIAFETKSINAYIGMEPVQLVPNISPVDATDKGVTWTSSDETIVTIDENGYMKAVAGGSCEITCTALDGSEKSAKIKVMVPSISIEREEYEVTEKSGLEIPFQYFGKNIKNVSVNVGNKSILSAKIVEGERIYVKITPEKAGSTTVTLEDSSNSGVIVKLDVKVNSSAVYDSTSYPNITFEKVMRSPDYYDGTQCQIYGKVQQKLNYSEYGIAMLLVRVNGENFVVYYFTKDVDVGVIEDDYITVYGTCSGVEEFDARYGSTKLTYPTIWADKIKIGRKSN